MIFVRQCGHSAETTERRYYKQPNRCYVCAPSPESRVAHAKASNLRDRIKKIHRWPNGRLMPKIKGMANEI